MSKEAHISTKKHARSSIRDAIYTNLNLGMVDSYFCAFMLTIGISEVIAGLGTVIPQFIGVIFQLTSIRSFFRKYSLKKRLLIFLSVQAFALIPLIMMGYFKINSAVLIISILGLYWASLLSLNPPWNRLIGHTIPHKFRLKFFSIRSQFAQASVLIGLLISGTALYWVQGTSRELTVFLVIFCIGFLLKCGSIFEVKNNHIDYPLTPGSDERIPFRTFLKAIRSTDQGKLIFFLFFFYISIHFSAPYFNPYMLGILKFNYIEYMGITSVAYFGRVFFFKILQKRAKSKHINKLLLIGVIGISTTPMLWAFNQNFWWIMGIEFLSGCYWAAFELSTILLYFQKIKDHERTSYMTYITFLNTTGMLIGSGLGAIFVKFVPTHLDSFLTLFAASTVFRLIMCCFAPHIQFTGVIPKIFINKIYSVRLPFGGLGRPFIEKKEDSEEEK